MIILQFGISESSSYVQTMIDDGIDYKPNLTIGFKYFVVNFTVISNTCVLSFLRFRRLELLKLLQMWARHEHSS